MLLDSFVRSESPQAYGVAGRDSTAARQGEWTNYQTKAINLVDLKSAYAPRLSGPIQFLHKLLKFWKLERSDAIGLLGYESGDAIFVYDMLEGRERPRGLDFKSRISHLLSIRAALDFFFRDLEAENRWLREEHSLLAGRVPLSMLLEGSIEDMQLVREYVDTMVGKY